MTCGVFLLASLLSRCRVLNERISRLQVRVNDNDAIASAYKALSDAKADDATFMAQIDVLKKVTPSDLCLATYYDRRLNIETQTKRF